jgi:translocation and assembly module TamA
MELPAARARALILLCLAGCGSEKAAGRPWVRSVIFEGVKSVRRRDLERSLAVERSRFFRLQKRYLDPFTVTIDAGRIVAYYHARGFFNARVITAQTIPFRGSRERPRAVDVRFVVDEGAPARVSSVAVTGLPEQPALARRAEQQLGQGRVFDHAAYLQARDGLAAELRRAGYPWPEVSGRVDVGRRRRQAKVQIDVRPGPRGRFGQLHVEGAEHSSTARLARYSGFPAGARFDPDRLDELRARVENLDLFSTVWVDYQAGEQPELADVVLHVRERARNELRLGGGVGFDAYRSDVHLSALYTRRNWLGGLRTLVVDVRPGWVAVPAFWSVERTGPSLNAEASLIQPDWPIPQGLLRVLLGYDLGVEYAYQFHGARTGVRVQRGFWRDRVLVGAGYEFELLQLFNADPVIVASPELAGRFFGYVTPYRLGWLQQDVTLDLRDAPLDAHRGVYVSLALEQGGPFAGGAFTYQKLQPELRLYAPLGSRVTLAGRFWFGQLFSEGDLGSPITRRFYLGGANSHRGFNYDRLSPQVPSGVPGRSAIPIGGDQLLLISAELRWKVLRILGEWLSFAAFTDGGDVGGPSCVSAVGNQCTSMTASRSIAWGDLYWAVGGGLRYHTVIGTVRADLGVRLNRLGPVQPDGTPNADPGNRFAFHLSLGEAF